MKEPAPVFPLGMRAAALLVLVLVAGACTPDGPAPVAASPSGAGEEGPGQLAVDLRLIYGKWSPFWEGALAFIEVRDGDGRIVLETPSDGGRSIRDRRVPFRHRLPAGTYVVTTYLRGCVGTCDYLDPRSHACRFTAETGRMIVVRADLGRDSCTVSERGAIGNT